MSKHTESPWLYTEDEVVDKYGGTIADASYRRHFPGVEANDPDVEAEIQANVCLMAAAPELLAACRAAVEHMEPDRGTMQGGYLELYDQLCAAIAQAEGVA